MATPLLQNVDCLGVQVPDIDEALKFYQKQLGQRLLGAHPRARGLRSQTLSRCPSWSSTRTPGRSRQPSKWLRCAMQSNVSWHRAAPSSRRRPRFPSGGSPSSPTLGPTISSFSTRQRGSFEPTVTAMSSACRRLLSFTFEAQRLLGCMEELLRRLVISLSHHTRAAA